MQFSHVLAWGLKTFTSKKARLNREPQIPFALMSSRASSFCTTPDSSAKSLLPGCNTLDYLMGQIVPQLFVKSGVKSMH